MLTPLKRGKRHYVFWKNNKSNYICNETCNTTNTKSVRDWKLVTCKNCLRSNAKNE